MTLMPWLLAGEISAKELGQLSRLSKAFMSASETVEDVDAMLAASHADDIGV